jgi:hypothetical protein
MALSTGTTTSLMTDLVMAIMRKPKMAQPILAGVCPAAREMPRRAATSAGLSYTVVAGMLHPFRVLREARSRDHQSVVAEGRTDVRTRL